MRYRVHWMRREHCFVVVNAAGAVIARCDEIEDAWATAAALEREAAERIEAKRRQAALAREALLRQRTSRARATRAAAG